MKQISYMFWTEPENKEVDRYFSSTLGEMALYQRLHKINPKRTYEAMSRRLRKLRAEGREKNKNVALSKLRIGYLDIEATNLSANFGHMLSWYIKKEGKNEYDYSVITKKEIFNYEFDKRLVKELLVALGNYDVIYTHWGNDRRFDIPFIRTRALAHGLEDDLPGYMEKFILDTYPIARNKLRLNSNRLGTIGEALGIENVKKTPLSHKHWQLAGAGNPESLKYIMIHNKRDVQLLERIRLRLKSIERPIYRSI